MPLYQRTEIINTRFKILQKLNQNYRIVFLIFEENISFSNKTKERWPTRLRNELRTIYVCSYALWNKRTWVSCKLLIYKAKSVAKSSKYKDLLKLSW